MPKATFSNGMLALWRVTSESGSGGGEELQPDAGLAPRLGLFCFSNFFPVCCGFRQVAGMSCGPTPDWDHDFGCAKGFGGFRGLEMPSATGPFAGMAMYMDDGTRFVAAFAAMPLVLYYEGTQDESFLRQRLMPLLREARGRC